MMLTRVASLFVSHNPPFAVFINHTDTTDPLKKMLRYILAIAVLLMIQTIIISGFAPTNTHQQHRVVASFRPANFVQAAMPTSASTPFLVLRMSSEEEGATSKIGADGTFYDDEVSTVVVMVLVVVAGVLLGVVVFESAAN
jgi:hypothetical protein